MSLGDLRELLGPFDVNWAPAPVHNIQRDSSKGQVAELFLSRTHRRALLARTLLAQDAKAPAAKLLEAKGNLRDWLLRQRQEFAGAGSELYVPAVEAEMLYFDEEVLTPIVRAIQSRGLGTRWSDVQQSRLQAAAAAAAVFRYGVTIYHDTSSSSEFVILSEVEANPRRRYWGTYVFRVGDSKPYVVQVPWPLIEANSFEFGVSLFDRQQAAAFLSVGAHPSANRNFSADVSRIQNRVNLFNLVGQVILREGGPEPLVVVQARAFGLQPNGKMPEADIVLASDNGACDRAGLSSLGKDLLQTLQEDRLTVRFADGSLETAGYRVGATVQAGYLTQAKNKEFVILWVSPQARIRYRQQIENQLQAGHFTALKIPTVEKRLYDHLEALGPRGGLVVVDEKIRALIERYADTQDLVALHTACSLGKAFRFERVIDSDSQQSFLLIHGSDKQFPLVANVGIRPAAAALLIKSRSVDRERIAEYVRTRATWLEIGGEP
jgi:hypothetical protein